MSKLCPKCGSQHGRITRIGAQDVVRCYGCNQFVYNAPRHETGLPAAHKNTRPNISVSQRARIFARDGNACIACHHADRALDLGHMLSVEDGHKLGATDRELFADENLAVMCDACNAGQGGRTVSLRLMYQMLQANMARNEGKW